MVRKRGCARGLLYSSTSYGSAHVISHKGIFVHFSNNSTIGALSTRLCAVLDENVCSELGKLSSKKWKAPLWFIKFLWLFIFHVKLYKQNSNISSYCFCRPRILLEVNKWLDYCSFSRPTFKAFRVRKQRGGCKFSWMDGVAHQSRNSPNLSLTKGLLRHWQRKRRRRRTVERLHSKHLKANNPSLINSCFERTASWFGNCFPVVSIRPASDHFFRNIYKTTIHKQSETVVGRTRSSAKNAQ